jgi:hypothetical protein
VKDAVIAQQGAQSAAPGIRLELGQFEISLFSLDRADEAVTYAARQTGIFEVTVVQP